MLLIKIILTGKLSKIRFFFFYIISIFLFTKLIYDYLRKKKEGCKRIDESLTLGKNKKKMREKP